MTKANQAVVTVAINKLNEQESQTGDGGAPVQHADRPSSGDPNPVSKKARRGKAKNCDGGPTVGEIEPAVIQSNMTPFIVGTAHSGGDESRVRGLLEPDEPHQKAA